MKRPFSWNAGRRENALAHLDVADSEALAPRFGHHRFFIDHLLQDLLLDAQLPQQLFVHLRAVGVAIGLQLRVVAPLKLADGDLLALRPPRGLR